MSERSTIIMPEFRVGWAQVFELVKNELSGKMECNVLCLFKKGQDLKELKKLCLEAGKTAWGPDLKKWGKIKNPTFRDQKELTVESSEGEGILRVGAIPGAEFCRIKSRQIPGIIDKKGKPILDKSGFYSGCWAQAEVSAFAYEFAGNKGISLWMTNLIKTRDDEPLSGRRKAEDVFKAIIDTSDDDDFLNDSTTAEEEMPF